MGASLLPLSHLLSLFLYSLPSLPFPFFLHPLRNQIKKKKKPATSSTPLLSFRLSTRPQKAKMASKTLLGAGAVLHKGEKLVSPNGKCEAVLQDDGNFVVYVDKKDVWAR